MDNRKQYIVPTLAYEDFTLSTKVAGVCGEDWVERAVEMNFFAGTDSCPLPLDGENAWNLSGGKVDGTIDICYHSIEMLYGS